MRHVAKCLEVYQLGDHLDDDEIEALGVEMRVLADASFRFGDMFRLQAVYADKVAHDCKQFLASRRERIERANKAA